MTPRKPIILILLSLCLAGLIAFSLLRQPEGHAAREATAVSSPVLRVLPSEKSPTVFQPNPTEKIEAIESFVPLRLRPGRFRPRDRLIASLMPGKTPPPPAQG